MPPEDQTEPFNTVGDGLPNDPGAVPSGKEKDETKADADRAKDERTLLDEGTPADAVIDTRDPIDPKDDPRELVRQTTQSDRLATNGKNPVGNNTGHQGDTDGSNLPAAASTGPDVEAAIRDSAGVKRFGEEIYNTFLANLRSLKPTGDEEAIGKRAAEELAYYSIAVIGLTEAQAANYADRAKRASSTLLNLAVGFSVEAKRVARDAVRQTIQRFFREAISLMSGATALL